MQCYSPDSNTPATTKVIMSQDDGSSAQINQPVNVPPEGLSPELQLLYSGLSELIDKKIQPIKQDLKLLLNEENSSVNQKDVIHDLHEADKILSVHVSRVEQESNSLKEQLAKIKNRMLDNNIVVSDIDKDKWEKDEPRREKINKTFAKI